MGRAEPDIRYLFSPSSIAVIGASLDTRKIGHKILDNIVSGGYPGKIYPINSRGDGILGFRGYKDIRDVEGDVDVAVIAVPAKFVLDVVKGCAEKGVKFTPIVSSGFSEIGNREGENKIVACARENGMRILGPNIFGVFSAIVSVGNKSDINETDLLEYFLQHEATRVILKKG